MEQRHLRVRFVEWALAHPRVPVWICAVLTLLALGMALRLEVNATPYLVGRDYPSRRFEEPIRSIFTNSGEQVIVAVVAAGDTVFNRETLRTVGELTRGIESMTLVDEGDAARVRALAVDDETAALAAEIARDGVERGDAYRISRLAELLEARAALRSADRAYLADLRVRAAPIRGVRSLSTLEDLSLEDDALRVAPLMEAVPESDAAIAELAETVRANAMLSGFFVGAGERATALQVELAIAEDDAPNMRRAHEELARIIEGVRSGDSLHLAGGPIILAEVARIMERDNTRFLPFVLLLVGGTLFLGFRSAGGVLLPLLIASLSVIWTVGVMAGLGVKLNVVTTTLPVFLVTIAVADAIHFLSQHRRAADSLPNREAIVDTFERLFRPLLLTSLTTMFGFLGLALTPFLFLQLFAIFTAIGVFFAFLLTALLIPAVLARSRPRAAPAIGPAADRLGRVAVRITRALGSHSRWALAALIAVAVVGGVLSSRVQAGFSNLWAFSPESPLRVDHAAITAHLGGTVPTDLWLRSEGGEAFSRADAIRAAAALQERAESHPEVGFSVSFADYLQRIHQVMSEDAGAGVPASDDLASQYYLVYDSSRGREIRDVLDAAHQEARIVVLANTDEGRDWGRILSDLEAYAASVLPEGVQLHVSGFGSLMRSIAEDVLRGQLISLATALVLVGLMMVALFRSLVLGVIALSPLALTLAINFGLLAALGFPLDPATVILAGMVFGIGVDYSIHFLAAVQRVLPANRGDLERSIDEAIREVAYPISVNSVSLSIGFLVLLLSSYGVIRNLGALVAGTLLLCALIVLLALPLLVRTLRPRALFRGVATEAAPLPELRGARVADR